MRPLNKLYWKIFAIFFIITVALGSIYILLTAKTVIAYFEEANQRLHSAVAKQIAADTEPFINGSVNKPVVQNLFHNIMTLNPGAEVYLLDKEGKLLSYSAPDSVVQLKKVSLEPIKQFIAADGNIFIQGDNPRHTEAKKVFAAAPVINHGVLRGYIYVILGGDKYTSITSILLDSYIFRIAVSGVLFTMVAALLIGFAAFLFITRDLNKITGHVKKFQEGNWDERIHIRSGGDLGLLSDTFNKMADTIAVNLENIKAMEQSRLELIANVSHDLRTPLAIIQGYAETLHLKKEILSDQEKEHYTQILIKSSTNLKKLVDELFELSKLDAKVTKLQKEYFSIAELLLDNVAKYRILAEEKCIHIDVNIDGIVPMVYADIGLTDRVLQNLMDNAIKFTPERGKIIAALQVKDKYVEVSISDNGIGIAPEKIPGIFERYSRADYTGADKSGIGLGLAIITKILELHETTLTVASQPSTGSIFSFFLPVNLSHINRG